MPTTNVDRQVATNRMAGSFTRRDPGDGRRGRGEEIVWRCSRGAGTINAGPSAETNATVASRGPLGERPDAAIFATSGDRVSLSLSGLADPSASAGLSPSRSIHLP